MSVLILAVPHGPSALAGAGATTNELTGGLFPSCHPCGLEGLSSAHLTAQLTPLIGSCVSTAFKAPGILVSARDLAGRGVVSAGSWWPGDRDGEEKSVQQSEQRR